MNNYVPREISTVFERSRSIYPAIALVGSRQAGKTTFLKAHINSPGIRYVLFDDPDVRSLFEKDIKKFEKQYIEGNEITILDEVHYCKEAGKGLKYLIDSGHRLWITSSSEILLSKEILSYLVGRVSIIRLYPFSFHEFLSAKKQKEINKEIQNRMLWEHAIYGGYPAAVLASNVEDKKLILGNLYETMLLKDVAQNFSIENTSSLGEFARYLALSVGGVISYSNISKNLGLSFQTMKKYLNAMEKSNLLYRVEPFFTNKLKEITKQPKIYFIDLGMRNYLAKEFRDNINGTIFENYVMTELLKMGYSPKYWRSKAGAEVDFVIEKDNLIIPVEVKLSNTGKIEKGMQSFIDEYSSQKAFIIFYNGNARKSKYGTSDVHFINIAELKQHF